MRQPPRPGSAHRSIWEGATICLGWCGLSVPALADQPFARICMANNFASISDLNVRVDRTARLSRSSGFKGFCGSKATYQISGCAMVALTPAANESFVRQCRSFALAERQVEPRVPPDW